jgi:Tfp pilus assembly protein PilN
MNHAQRLLTAFVLSLPLCAHASEITDAIRALVPDGVTVESLDESDGFVAVSGVAPGNEQISALMRAVSQSRLGDPELQSIKREDDASHFRLRVRLRKQAGEADQ